MAGKTATRSAKKGSHSKYGRCEEDGDEDEDEEDSDDDDDVQYGTINNNECEQEEDEEEEEEGGLRPPVKRGRPPMDKDAQRLMMSQHSVKAVVQDHIEIMDLLSPATVARWGVIFKSGSTLKFPPKNNVRYIPNLLNHTVNIIKEQHRKSNDNKKVLQIDITNKNRRFLPQINQFFFYKMI